MAPLPSLRELGSDLIAVSCWDVVVSIARPAACLLLYWILALNGYYILSAPAVAAWMFFTYASTSHDLVHRTLRLPDAVNEAMLATIEALALRSGHAFRLTHLHHHKRFPHEDDIEGAEASKSFWRALACGPGHQVRQFLWAWRRADRAERRWMFVEAAAVLAIIVLAILTWPRLPELGLYVVLAIVGSWIYPLATVWWPHRTRGTGPLDHTLGFRGRIVPALFFQHTYHLEHHLYPGVSSHRWAELGRRLEPHLARAGVTLNRLP